MLIHNSQIQCSVKCTVNEVQQIHVSASREVGGVAKTEDGLALNRISVFICGNAWDENEALLKKSDWTKKKKIEILLLYSLYRLPILIVKCEWQANA